MLYSEMSKEELIALKKKVDAKYDDVMEENLSLNMARGKPSSAQVSISLPMLDVLDSKSEIHSEDGANCLNYGGYDGIPEAKKTYCRNP